MKERILFFDFYRWISFEINDDEEKALEAFMSDQPRQLFKEIITEQKASGNECLKYFRRLDRNEFVFFCSIKPNKI